MHRSFVYFRCPTRFNFKLLLSARRHAWDERRASIAEGVRIEVTDPNDSVAAAVEQVEALVSLALHTGKRGDFASSAPKVSVGLMQGFAPAPR